MLLFRLSQLLLAHDPVEGLQRVIDYSGAHFGSHSLVDVGQLLVHRIWPTNRSPSHSTANSCWSSSSHRTAVVGIRIGEAMGHVTTTAAVEMLLWSHVHVATVVVIVALVAHSLAVVGIHG